MQNSPTFEMLADQAPVMMWMSGIDKHATYFNKPWLEFTGRTLEQELGLGWLESTHPDDRARVRSVYDGAFARRAQFQMEFRLLRHDGAYRWILSSGSPRYSSEHVFEGYIGSCVDITARKRAEEALQQSNENLRLLSDHLNTIRENERTMIAREVHDELGQVFTALKLELMTLLQAVSVNSSEIPPRLYSIMEMIESGIKSVQHISSSLRPRILDDLGLVSAIEWEAEQFQKRTGIPVRLTLPDEEVAIEKDISTAVFRIIQESLTNILRHAQATRIAIDLHVKESEVAFSVRDNGKGIPEPKLADAHSLGLIGIRERIRMLGGRINILNNADGGVSVCANVPLHKSVSNES